MLRFLSRQSEGLATRDYHRCSSSVCMPTRSKWIWSKEAEQSLTAIKQLPANSSALALFHLTLHTIVSTDASDYYSLETILSQVRPDGVEQTVAYASHTLSSGESKYAKCQMLISDLHGLWLKEVEIDKSYWYRILLYIKQIWFDIVSMLIQCKWFNWS